MKIFGGNSRMNVLSISPQGAHDSSAAIVCNGKLVAHCEEERFTRKKHDERAPASATKFCLQKAGLVIDDVDAIVVPLLPGKLFRSCIFGLNDQLMLESSSQALSSRLFAMAWHFPPVMRFRVEKFVKSLKPKRMPEIVFMEHHRAHAASAFYCSGKKRAAVITVDGSGELNSTVVWRAKGNTIEKVGEESYKNSLGAFYTRATEFMGLGKWGEGQTMGLAPYGKPNDAVSRAVSRVLNVKKGKWYKYDGRALNEKSVGFKRGAYDAVLKKPYPDFAFAVQKALENALLNVVQFAVDATGERDLCLAGGVALNCTANSTILNSGLVDDCFIFPASNDGGVTVGAALEYAAQNGENVSFKLAAPYFGPSYSDDEIKGMLKYCNLKYEKSGDIAGDVAELMNKGKVVGWFQGRMESGPRALGNRSIVADPSRPDTHKKLNLVKNRALWRPLAPSMLFEAKEEYLEKPRDSPFMILSFDVKEEKRREVPALVHVDGSTRPQTVKKDANPVYWRLIKSFERESGIPIVMNTSFNDHDEAIVCSPKNAIETFYSTAMDCLAIGSFLVKK